MKMTKSFQCNQHRPSLSKAAKQVSVRQRPFKQLRVEPLILKLCQRIINGEWGIGSDSQAKKTVETIRYSINDVITIRLS